MTQQFTKEDYQKALSELTPMRGYCVDHYHEDTQVAAQFIREVTK